MVAAYPTPNPVRVMFNDTSLLQGLKPIEQVLGISGRLSVSVPSTWGEDHTLSFGAINVRLGGC